MGRVKTITNPHRSVSAGTDGTTQFVYDALGRTTDVIKQDGNTTHTDYAGNATTVRDETGRQRHTVSDGLDRLVEVDEPGDSFKSTGGISIGGVPAGQGNQPIVAGSSLTSFSDGFGQHLFSVGSDQHIYQSYWNGTTWANQDLTAASAGALATPGSPLTSYTMDLSAWNLGQNENIFFLCANQHICSLWWTSTTGNWVYQDLTAATGGVAAAAGSTLASTATDLSAAGQGKAEFVYYLGANQHVYQLWWNTNTWTWQNQDLTALANAALAAPGSALSSYATDLTSAGLGLNTFLFYIGTNQHVYQLWWNTVNFAWQSADLTASSNGAVTASGSKLTGFSIDLSAVQLGMNELVFYTGTNQHIYALWWSSSNFTWQNQDLTAMTSCPLALAAGALTSFADGSSEHVYFFGTDQHLNELVWSTGTWTWNHGDLTTGTNDSTAAAGSGLTGFADNSGEHVFDVGSDLLVDQVTFSNGTWQASNPGIRYVTLYNYDGLGNIICVEQHGNASGTGCSSPPSSDATSPWRIRRFTYDSLSRLLSARNPESGTITYQYDNESNLVEKTDARNVTVTYNPIDALHRVITKTYSDGTPTVNYGYDLGCCGVNPLYGIGRMTGNTELVYVYDQMGRIKVQADCPPSGIARGFCYTISAGYDLAGEMTSLNYPDGRVLNMAYNSAGRQTGVTLPSSNFTYYSVPQTQSPTSWGYWPSGAMNRGTYGNGVIETTSYNNRLQVNAITDAKGATTLFSKTFGYNDSSGHDNGDILSITDTLAATKNQTFTYDSLNRIATGAQADNSFNLTFSYDAWGNMTESGTSNFPPAGFDVTNRVKQSTSCTPNLVPFCYDSAGDMLMDNHNHAFTYDGEARIKTVDGTAATYTYNPLGNRVRKDAGATSTEYFFFAGNVIAELDPSTGAYTDYIFGYGKRIAKDTSTNGSAAQYYHDDQIGSARVMTDSAGNKISDCTFNPFGEQVSCSPDNASNHYRFSGKERDTESGLDYFGARYLSSAMGRFTSPDPLYLEGHRLVDPQQWNIYAYARNNPLKFTDPTGLDVTCTGNRCDDYLKALQKNLSFKVTMDKNGKVGTEGDIDKKHLSKTEKQLLKAIDDTKHHVTINAIGGGKDSSVFFGASHGASHTIAFDQAALLDSPKNAGGMTSAQLVGHETLEGYAESEGESLHDAHNFANGFFPGLDPGRITGLYENPQTGIAYGFAQQFQVHGTNTTENIGVNFVTPIPVASVHSGMNAAGYPVSVEKAP